MHNNDQIKYCLRRKFNGMLWFYSGHTKPLVEYVSGVKRAEYDGIHLYRCLECMQTYLQVSIHVLSPLCVMEHWSCGTELLYRRHPAVSTVLPQV